MKTLNSAKANEEVKVIITGSKYMDEGENLFEIYTGTKRQVVEKVADNHSYGYDEDISLEENLQEIESKNGDGCDYISIIQVSVGSKVVSII